MAASLDALFTLATNVALLLTVLLGGKYADTGERSVPEWTSSQLSSRIWNPQEKAPVCILYSRSDKGAELKLEREFSKFVKNLPDSSSLRDWTFASINTSIQTILPSAHPAFLPCLQCHIGASAPLVYSPQGSHNPSVKSIRKWMKKTVEYEFSERIPPIHFMQLTTLLSTADGIALIGIPGNLYHEILENGLKEVTSKWQSSIHIFMILPSTDAERNITQAYGIQMFPAVLLFEKKVWSESRMPSLVLQGPLNTRTTQINLELTIRHLQNAVILGKGNFEDKVMDSSSPLDPIAVTFYSPRNPRTPDYMYILDKTINKFATIDSSFRFGLVDLVNNSDVISRYVDASFVTAIPFLVVFWQEAQGTNMIVKQLLFNNQMPLAQDLYDFLRDNDVPLSTDEARDERWSDHKDVCEPRPLDTHCIPGDNPGDNSSVTSLETMTVFGPEPAPPGWTRKINISNVKHIPKVRAKRNILTPSIPHVTDITWEALIEHSVPPPQTGYGTKRDTQPSQAFTVALVVFIKDNCAYCNLVIPTLEEIAKSTRYAGASMYLMNCSSSPANCKKQGITGYPTLVAFRSLSWSSSERCFPRRHASGYIRTDYHGPVVPNLVLEWLSGVSHAAVNRTFFDDELPSDLGADDVRLVATMYTRALARRYLPSYLYNKWYPYDCYNLLCELLHGTVPCYAVYTRDVVDYLSKSKTDEKELVVSKLVMQRADGVHIRLFELGYSLESTLNDISDTRLHQFHHPHRYNLRAGFKCEDNHAECNDVVLRFVIDHKRLPVSHITSSAFHAKTSDQLRHSDDIFTHELPIMLILAHGNNITRHSKFMKDVTQAAYVLYREMVFVTLNTDEFSFWAGNFVPKGYHAKHAYASDSSQTSALYHYPRLCIVRWEDHQHAAFYPPLDRLEKLPPSKVRKRLDNINTQQIIDFAQQYLVDPNKMLVRTELF